MKNGSVIINLEIGKFDAKNHTLLYKDNELQYIDGKVFWGADGEAPKEKIRKLRITIDERLVEFPFSAFTDLYEPNLKSLRILSGPDKTLYIRMDNSDGAGAYTVIWVIKEGKYLARYIDDSND